MAALAKVGRLARFDDLTLIEQYAAKFGQEPNWVYSNTDFGTIKNFSIMWKEQGEFNQRFQHIWHELTKDAK